MHVNDETIHAGVEVQDAFDEVKPGARIELLLARNNLPVELSGTYEPQAVQPPPKLLFARSAPSGRVDLTRAGNTVQATTRGVAQFTLLLSPDQFDFSKPVNVIVNGRTAFSGRVQNDLKTLLKWAAIDNDRTMLFGAEVRIEVPR